MTMATCGRDSSRVGCFLSPASSAGAGEVVVEVGLVEGGVLQSPIWKVEHCESYFSWMCCKHQSEIETTAFFYFPCNSLSLKPHLRRRACWARIRTCWPWGRRSALALVLGRLHTAHYFLVQRSERLSDYLHQMRQGNDTYYLVSVCYDIGTNVWY